jgi:ATP-dependent protease ClpP protease subunit
MKSKLFATIVLAVFCGCSCSASQVKQSQSSSSTGTSEAVAVADTRQIPHIVLSTEIDSEAVAVADTRQIPHIVLSTEIDSEVAEQTVAIFTMINAEPDRFPAVLFEINSPGGSVAGFRIAKALEDSEVPVVCVVDGLAASMAFYILQSCDTRLMTGHSLLMAHEPSMFSMNAPTALDLGAVDGIVVSVKETKELLIRSLP